MPIIWGEYPPKPVDPAKAAVDNLFGWWYVIFFITAAVVFGK